MIAVIFEVIPDEGQTQAYLDHAADLRPLLEQADGFISVERFQSLTDSSKLLSLSYWDSEDAVRAWRQTEQHRASQAAGRADIFRSYRIRVAQVLRDYTLDDRAQAPADSRAAHSG